MPAREHFHEHTLLMADGHTKRCYLTRQHRNIIKVPPRNFGSISLARPCPHNEVEVEPHGKRTVYLRGKSTRNRLISSPIHIAFSRDANERVASKLRINSRHLCGWGVTVELISSPTHTEPSYGTNERAALECSHLCSKCAHCELISSPTWTVLSYDTNETAALEWETILAISAASASLVSSYLHLYTLNLAMIPTRDSVSDRGQSSHLCG